MFRTLWTHADIQSSSPLQYNINQMGCKIKIQNSSRYALDVYVGEEHTDRVEPYSYSVLPNSDYTVKLNRTVASKNVQESDVITFKSVGDDVNIGSTQFQGSTNVEGDVNVEGTVNIDGVVNVAGNVGIDGDVHVNGEVNANITNAEINAQITGGTVNVAGSVQAEIVNPQINVAGSVDATITGGTVNIGGGTVQAEITSGSVNATIQNAQINSEIVNTSLSTNEMAMVGSVAKTLRFRNGAGNYAHDFVLENPDGKAWGVFDTFIVMAKSTKSQQQNGSPEYNLNIHPYFGRIMHTNTKKYEMQASSGTGTGPHDCMLTQTLTSEKPVSSVQVSIEYAWGGLGGTFDFTDDIQFEVYAYNSDFSEGMGGVEELPQQTNLNTLEEKSGWFVGNNLLNAPSINYFYISQVIWSSERKIQFAYRQSPTPSNYSQHYFRTYDLTAGGSGWGAWKRVSVVDETDGFSQSFYTKFATTVAYVVNQYVKVDFGDWSMENNFDSVNREYVIPDDGFYSMSANILMSGLVAGTYTTQYLRFGLNGDNAHCFATYTDTERTICTLSATHAGYYKKGDRLSVWVYSTDTTGSTVGNSVWNRFNVSCIKRGGTNAIPGTKFTVSG